MGTRPRLTLLVDLPPPAAIPVRHWGKRWPWGMQRGYNGYVLEVLR